MSEWWTYSLSDFLMFSPRSWYRLLAAHNQAWAPAQGLATALLVVALLALRGAVPRWPRLLLACTGLAWCLVAWGFHAQRFAQINWAASYFALGFALQGALLLGAAVLPLTPPQPLPAFPRWTARALLLLAAAYPLLALVLGRPLAQAEWFGLMPEPTVLATLGLLLVLRVSALLRVLPLAWCAVAGAMLWTLGAPEALLLPVAGALAVAAGWHRATPGHP